MKRNTCINAISANEARGGRYDAKLWTVRHVIITMGALIMEQPVAAVTAVVVVQRKQKNKKKQVAAIT